jgi:hypothetical protein
MKQGRGDTHRGSRNNMHVMATMREESRDNIESNGGSVYPKTHEREGQHECDTVDQQER